MTQDVSSTGDATGQVRQGVAAFPKYEPVQASPDYSGCVAQMRRLLDVIRLANPGDDVWSDVAGRVREIADLLEPEIVAERDAPAGLAENVPGFGSLLMPAWTITDQSPEGVTMSGHFGRFYLGANNVVHGGALPLLFDWHFALINDAACRPISRTAYLHIDYRAAAWVDAPLIATGRVDSVVGRKTYLSAELTSVGGNTVVAQAKALMVTLLAHQP